MTNHILTQDQAQFKSLRDAAAAYVGDIPRDEQPIERLFNFGPSSLSAAEVLAVLLSDKDLLDAQHLLSDCKGVKGLARVGLHDLTNYHGIGRATAARIQAAIELGRRILLERWQELEQVRSPGDVAQVLMPEMSLLQQEEMRVILLDTKNQIVDISTVYVGSVNSCLIRVGELFQPAIAVNAAAIIIAHNHPSGDPTPSPEDAIVTKKIVEAGKLLDIEVLDHLVVGKNCFVSLKERGLMGG